MSSWRRTWRTWLLRLGAEAIKSLQVGCGLIWFTQKVQPLHSLLWITPRQNPRNSGTAQWILEFRPLPTVTETLTVYSGVSQACLFPARAIPSCQILADKGGFMTVWGCMRLVCNYVCNDVEGWVSEEYVLGYHSSEFYEKKQLHYAHFLEIFSSMYLWSFPQRLSYRQL